MHKDSEVQCLVFRSVRVYAFFWSICFLKKGYKCKCDDCHFADIGVLFCVWLWIDQFLEWGLSVAIWRMSKPMPDGWHSISGWSSLTFAPIALTWLYAKKIQATRVMSILLIYTWVPLILSWWPSSWIRLILSTNWSNSTSKSKSPRRKKLGHKRTFTKWILALTLTAEIVP